MKERRAARSGWKGQRAGPAEVEEEGRRNEHGRGVKGRRLRPQSGRLYLVLFSEVPGLALERRGKKVKSVEREGIGSYCEGWRLQGEVERKPRQTAELNE